MKRFLLLAALALAGCDQSQPSPREIARDNLDVKVDDGFGIVGASMTLQFTATNNGAQRIAAFELHCVLFSGSTQLGDRRQQFMAAVDPHGTYRGRVTVDYKRAPSLQERAAGTSGVCVAVDVVVDKESKP